MGAWGVGPFDNDDAMDLIGDLEESSDASAVLASAMDALINAEGYAEASDVSVAVAAAVLVAARHAGLDPGSSTVADWLSGDPFAATPQLREVARRALQRASHETDNELYALWVEAGEQDIYRSALAPYQDALSR